MFITFLGGGQLSGCKCLGVYVRGANVQGGGKCPGGGKCRDTENIYYIYSYIFGICSGTAYNNIYTHFM